MHNYLKYIRAADPGLFYFALVRMFESIVDLFSKLEQTVHGSFGPDFDEINHEIERLRESLLTMGGYKQGDEIQERFQEAWAAVYELKTIMIEFQEMQHLAEEKFGLRRP